MQSPGAIATNTPRMLLGYVGNLLREEVPWEGERKEGEKKIVVISARGKKDVQTGVSFYNLKKL